MIYQDRDGQYVDAFSVNPLIGKQDAIFGNDLNLASVAYIEPFAPINVICNRYDASVLTSKPFDTFGLLDPAIMSVQVQPTIEEQVQVQQERIESLESQNIELLKRIEQLQAEKEHLKASSRQQESLHQNTEKCLLERVTKLEYYLNHLLPDMLKNMLDDDDDHNFLEN